MSGGGGLEGRIGGMVGDVAGMCACVSYPNTRKRVEGNAKG